MNSIARLLLPIALLALVACGGGSDVEGTWKLDSDALLADNEAAMNPEGVELSAEDQEMILGFFKQMDATLELKGDGTMSGTIKMPNPLTGDAATSDMTGTWKLDGAKISMTSKDSDTGALETMNGTLAGDKITVIDDSDGQAMTMTFVRQ